MSKERAVDRIEEDVQVLYEGHLRKILFDTKLLLQYCQLKNLDIKEAIREIVLTLKMMRG